MKKVKRKIVVIDEEKCNGCGACIISCPEQAIEIVETEKGPRARLVKEFYCDGLGACLGSCPENAIKVEEKEAEPYDEEATVARIKEVAPQMLEVHIKHMKEHAKDLPEHHSHKMQKGITSCPSAQTLSWKKEKKDKEKLPKVPSELRQWPIQLHLVNPSAPYFKGADLLIVADCVPFAYGSFHQDFLKDKAIAIGCPKLDDVQEYIEKVRKIVEEGSPKSIKILHMEVPCCFGLVYIVKEAIKKSKKKVSVEEKVISIRGDVVD